MQKKWCILPGKLCKEKKTVFACVKTYVNALYQSVLTSNVILLCIAQNQHFRKSEIPKDQNWCSRCDKFVSHLFKHVFQLLLSIWPVLLEYLHHFYVVIFFGVFWDVCFCLSFFVVLLCFAVTFILSSFVFIFAKILALAVKIPDVTTAAVELNIITIIVSLLWTLEIVHYSWELPVQ